MGHLIWINIVCSLVFFLNFQYNIPVAWTKHFWNFADTVCFFLVFSWLSLESIWHHLSLPLASVHLCTTHSKSLNGVQEYSVVWYQNDYFSAKKYHKMGYQNRCTVREYHTVWFLWAELLWYMVPKWMYKYSKICSLVPKWYFDDQECHGMWYQNGYFSM